MTGLIIDSFAGGGGAWEENPWVAAISFERVR